MSTPRQIQRALISVFDKTGIVEFVRALHAEFGVEIVSTGGTAAALRQDGIPVTLIEDVTGFPEMLDGRVKTLHPRIHAAILANRDNPAHMRQLTDAGIRPIDVVVVNLYPFALTVADAGCTFAQAVEMIDIGGVALLRAAAKNHQHVVVLSSPARQEQMLSRLRQNTAARDESDEARWRAACAWETLWRVSQYDAAIAAWLADQPAPEPLATSLHALHLESAGPPLRYGENPHQQARVHALADGGISLGSAPPADANPPLSYNNYLDADAALGLCCELSRAASGIQSRDARRYSADDGAEPTVCFIKHTNACGVGVAAAAGRSAQERLRAQAEAYRRAYLGDPNAAMGGVLACNFVVDTAFAAIVLETYARLGKPLSEAGAPHAPGGFFVEVWIAPRFTEDAVKLIRGTLDPVLAAPEADEAALALMIDPASAPPRKDWGTRVRLLAVGDMHAAPDARVLQYRSIAGGMLSQTPDLAGLNEDHWRVVTRRAPTAQERADLRLAWLICKHTKSNAISICRDGRLLGNGAGQMSRVMSCRVATWLARDNGHLGEFTPRIDPPLLPSDAAARRAAPVAASDAFFPFPDGPRVLIEAGVRAIIQPGGGKRDQDVIDLCDAHGVAMILTGTRHFRH